MPRLDEVGDCPLCFGRLLPLSVCQTCGSTAARPGLEEVGPQIPCEDCGATNPTHFACSACNARFPYGEIVKAEGPTCPVCRSPVPVGAELCPTCSAVLPVAGARGARPRRRIRGEYGEEDVHEIARIPGVGRTRAEALCAGGYNALWKVSRATAEELAAVKGIGDRTATQIKDALRFLLVIGRPKSKEEVLSEEYACPLCGTVTSLFASTCHECGASFDEEELDEEFRREVEREEDKGLLAYYDVRLLENPESAELHRARAMLLLAMGRATDALTALDKVLEVEPGSERALQAKARALAAARGMGSAAKVLRDAVDSLRVPGMPGGREMGEEEAEAALRSLGVLEELCPECGETQAPGALVCPVCGHRFAEAPTPSKTEEDRLLEELERAVAGEEKAPPPPLAGEVPAEVVARKRAMLSFLLKIPGVSRRAAEATSGFFQNLEQIGMSEPEDLAAIPGVAPAEGRLIREAVDRFLAPPEKVPEAVPEPSALSPTPAPTPPLPEPPAIPAPRPELRPALRRPLELTRRGLVNGQGLVNGRGRVNGLINGTGFINGVSIAELRLPRKSLMPRYVAIGAALLMVFAIAAALVPTERGPPAIVIDGAFEDWKVAPVHVDGTAASNPDVAIREVSLFVADEIVFLRVQVGGAIFGVPADYATVYAFLDVDADGTTGYDLAEDFGADGLVRMSGSGGSVLDARLLLFDSSDRQNWTQWRPARPVSAVAAGPQLEAAVPIVSLGDLLEAQVRADLRVLFVVDDNAGETSRTIAPASSGGAILVIHRELAPTLVNPGVQPFVEVTFRALGAPAPLAVRNVTIDTTGGSFTGLPGGMTLTPGTPSVHVVSVNPAGPPGALVAARVTAVDADVPVAIVGIGERAYLGVAPTAKRIDGLYSDWLSAIPDGDPGTIPRRALNLVSRDGAAVGSDVFLYARLDGDALEGSLAPDRFVRPGPPGAPGPSAPYSPPPRRFGEDFLRFYVNTNTGAPTVLSDGFAADRLVEVRGRNGMVTNASLYRWSGSDWRWEAQVPDIGLGSQEIELRVAFPTVGFNHTRLVALTGDWKGIADRADAGTRGGTRGGPGLVLHDGSGALTATASPLTNTPTVDAECGDPAGEYDGADSEGNANLSFLVGAKDGFVYVCLSALADNTDDTTADWAHLYFDRDHLGGSTPQADDRRFNRTSGGGSGSFSQWKGDGTGWVDCGGECSPDNAAAGAFNSTLSYPVYEFKISFWDIWLPDQNATVTDVAGFAVIAHDADGAGTNYTWGATGVDGDNPGTWGHLEIPEFEPLAAVALGVLLIAGAFRRRRRRS